MKKLVLTLTLAIAALLSFAQIPQTFSYQGVVRDADNKLVTDKQVMVSVQILQGTDEGAEVYAETHQVTTNANGLMTFELGSKKAEDFAKIDWSNAPYFVKTVATFDGKQISGVTPLLAVPYALYAAKAGNADVDLSAYATKEELPNVEGLASESYVNEKVAEIEIPSTDGFATKDELNALNIPSVEGLASESYVNEKVATIEIPSTEGLASESYVDEKVAEIDLSNYYLKSDVDALLAELNAKVKKLDKQLNPPAPPVGSKSGLFSVSAEKQVYFSQGNMQYQASTGTWRFAENQWDFVGTHNDDVNAGTVEGSDNANISETYEGWIDLFGWGTSGYNGKNPYMTSTTETDYGDGENDIASTNYDWGVYNKISNGGNQAGMWRTLTMEEWVYIYYERTDASNKYGYATVNNVKGLVLLPDDWTLPADLSFKSSSSRGYGSNIYSTEEWTKMEANGAVFLPAAGTREGTEWKMGNFVRYWLATSSFSGYAYYIFCDGGQVTYANYGYNWGKSVRLVHDAE